MSVKKGSEWSGSAQNADGSVHYHMWKKLKSTYSHVFSK